eukprot:gene8402-biopygen10644
MRRRRRRKESPRPTRSRWHCTLTIPFTFRCQIISTSSGTCYCTTNGDPLLRSFALCPGISLGIDASGDFESKVVLCQNTALSTEPCLPPLESQNAGVTGHWRGHGAGVAWAYRQFLARVARAWRGHGAGVARAWPVTPGESKCSCPGKCERRMCDGTCAVTPCCIGVTFM